MKSKDKKNNTKKDGLEEIEVYEIVSDRKKYKMNLSMLLAHARMSGGEIKIRIGQWDCLFRVLTDPDD